METRTVTLLMLQACIVLRAFTSFCECACPIYFLNTTEIVCIMENNTKLQNYEHKYVKLGNCDFVDRYAGWIQLKFIDCPFDYKRLRQFPARRITLFSSAEENRNTVLRANIFIFMCEVESIILMKANIREIEKGAFNCLNKIQHLDLRHNYIEILPEGEFRNMINLERFYLEFNFLKFVGRLAFGNLERLNVLHLHQNQLKTIDEPFLRNPRLQYLSVSDNLMDSLSKHVFAQSENLKVVDIRNNRLKVIHPETFGILKNLEQLLLSGNYILSLNGGLFQNNSNLMTLSLSFNNLTEILDGDFRGLSSLTHLYLTSNSIQKLSGNSFKFLTSLRVLLLDSNELTSLYSPDSSIFFGLQLEALLLRDNKLKNVSNAFHNSSINTLDISKNYGFVLDNDTFKEVKNLTQLWMTHCNLTSIPKEIFKNTLELHIIIICFNEIREIDPMTFSFINLTEINLSYNKLEKFDVSPFKGIAYLNLSSNNIVKLENNQHITLKNLIQFDVSLNLLTEYTLKTPNLEFLNISMNRISSLNGIFPDDLSKSIIDVSANNLSYISKEEWISIVNVYVFYASYNKIEEVILPEQSDYYSLTKLSCFLELEENRIENIRLPEHTDRSFMFGLENRFINFTYNIYVSDNPIRCRCSAYDVHRYLNSFDSSRHYINFTETFICHDPPELKGKFLRDLDPMQFLCYYPDDCSKETRCSPARDCEERCSCYFRPHDGIWIVNCRYKGYDDLPREILQETNVLLMDYNNVRSLSELKEPVWRHLKEISIEYNDIDSEDIPIPENVTILKLKGNKLKTFPTWIQKHAQKRDDFRVTLSENLWACDCSILSLKMFLLSHPYNVEDAQKVTCSFSNGSKVNLVKVKDLDLCPSKLTTYFVATVLLSMAFVAAIVSLYHRNRLFILAFLYTRCNWIYRLFCCNKVPNESKTYDGFLAYGHDDFLAAEAIVKNMEEQPPNYRMCVHDRDWLAGEHIITNIITSVERSRKTLVIVSASFLQSIWFPLEFEAAFYQALQDRRDRMIVIVKGDLPPLSELPDNVRYFLSTRTYLRWGEPLFFDRLRFAMHHEGPFVMDQIPQRRRRAAVGGLPPNLSNEVIELMEQ